MVRLFNHEGDFGVDPVFDDLVLLHDGLHALYVERLDVSHRLGGGSDGVLSSIFPARVGLGQNFAALKALSTDGINKGHMSLHARNIAIQAGATGKQIDQISQKMIEDGRIKQDYAEELLKEY